jgi:hypothetical protein
VPVGAYLVALGRRIGRSLPDRWSTTSYIPKISQT